MKEIRICFGISSDCRVVVTLKQDGFSVYRRSADMYPSPKEAQSEIDTLLTHLCEDVLHWLSDATIVEQRLDDGTWLDITKEQ